MRTGTINGNTITYPDMVCFAFNPNRITILAEGTASFLIGATGTIREGGVFDSTFDMTFRATRSSFIDERDGNKSKIVLDVSPYLQAMFETDIIGLMPSKNIDVQVEMGAEKLLFTLNTIWGSIGIGENITEARKVKKFADYPFTVSYFDNGMIHGTVESAPSYITVEHDECANGVYLRWIDKHGFYQYWLFGYSQKELSSDEYGEKLYKDFESNGIGHYGVSRMQGMTMEQSEKLCASLVDEEYYDMLSTIIGSPIIDMYVDGIWMPVRVESTNLTKKTDHLQDFEITILLPDIMTQRL